MTKLPKAMIMILVAGLVIGGAWSNSAIGQVKKGKSRPLTTAHLMEGLVAPNCGALKKGLDAGATDEKALKGLLTNAELLNEASHILMADGRCPDGDWAGAAKTLGECSEAVVKALEAKDMDKAKAAFGDLTKACGACHSKHKK